MYVYDICGRFHFALDMNADSSFTLTDVWLILRFLWLLPAKVVVGLVDNFPQLAIYMDVDCQTGNSWAGVVFSFFVWGMLFMTVWVSAVIRNEKIKAVRMRPKERNEQK